MMTTTTHSVRATEKLAAQWAQTLQGGQCVALDGPLGAGKTQFVRGLVRGLGGDGASVSSPTYTLLNIYDSGRLVVYHLDAYRVSEDDLEAIGFSELLEQGGLVVVEWPQRAADLLPPQTLYVRITPVNPTTRSIELSDARSERKR